MVSQSVCLEWREFVGISRVLAGSVANRGCRRIELVWSEGADSTPRTYEDLWYHQGRAQGSRRYCTLDIDKTKSGIVIVRNSEDVTKEPRAVANAIVKLTVELALKNIVCLAFVVPKDIAASMSSTSDAVVDSHS